MIKSKSLKKTLVLLFTLVFLAAISTTVVTASAATYEKGQFGGKIAELADPHGVLSNISSKYAEVEFNPTGELTLFNAGGKYFHQQGSEYATPRYTYNALLNTVFGIPMNNCVGENSGKGGWFWGGDSVSRNRSTVGSPIDLQSQVSGTTIEVDLVKINGENVATLSDTNNFKFQNYTYGFLVRKGSNGEIYFSRGKRVSAVESSITFSDIPQSEMFGAEMNYFESGGTGFTKFDLDFKNMVAEGVHPYVLAQAVSSAAKEYNEYDVATAADKKTDGLAKVVLLKSPGYGEGITKNAYAESDTEKVVKMGGVYLQMAHTDDAADAGQPFAEGSQSFVLPGYERNMFFAFNPEDGKAYPVTGKFATLYGGGASYDSLGNTGSQTNIPKMGYPMGKAETAGEVTTQVFSNGIAKIENGVAVFEEYEYFKNIQIEEDKVSIDLGTANSKYLGISTDLDSITPDDTLKYIVSDPSFLEVDTDGKITGKNGSFGEDAFKKVTVTVCSNYMYEKLGAVPDDCDSVIVYVVPGGVKAASVAFTEESYRFGWNKSFKNDIIITSSMTDSDEPIPVTNDKYVLSCDNTAVDIQHDIVRNDIIASGVEAVRGTLTVTLPASSMAAGASNTDSAEIMIYPSTVGMFDPGYNGAGVSWFSEGGRTKTDYAKAFIDGYCHIAFTQGYIMGEGSKDESRIREWSGFLIQEFLSDNFEYSVWERKHAYLIIDNPANTEGKITAYPLPNPVVKYISENGGLEVTGAPRGYEIRVYGMRYQNYANGLMVIHSDADKTRFMEGWRIEETSGVARVYDQNGNEAVFSGLSFSSENKKSVEEGAFITLDYGANGNHPFFGATWTSSDDSVATVENGVVTGIKEGSVTITLTSLFDPEIKITTTVKVNKKTETPGGDDDPGGDDKPSGGNNSTGGCGTIAPISGGGFGGGIALLGVAGLALFAISKRRKEI